MIYRRDVDGLRAVAVLMVLVFHFDLLGIGDAGFAGVDVFFVISGYLITTIVWREIVEGHFSLRTFYAKRIRRLAPALFVVQAALLVAGCALLLPLELKALAKESVFTQFYLSNIYYLFSIDYFGVQAQDAFLLHSWSLAVEEQFYLLYPLFLVSVARWLRGRLAAALLALALASFAANLLLVAFTRQASFYMLPSRAWELALGGLLPFAEPWLRTRGNLRRMLGWAGMAAIGGVLAVYRPGMGVPGWFALLPTAGAGAIILAGGGGGGAAGVSGLLSLPAMVWIGRISYPLYLVHWPLHVMAMRLVPSYGPAWRWGMFALSFVLAWSVFALVERRVQAAAALRDPRQIFGAYAAALVAIMLALAGVWTGDGWPARFAAPVLRVADVARDVDPRRGAWNVGRFDAVRAMLRPIGRAGAPRRWLVFGDSHAAALTRAFSLFLAGRGEAGSVVSRNGCTPVVDSGTGICRRFNREVLELVANDRVIRDVAIVSIWHQPMEADYLGHDGRALNGAGALRDFATSFDETIGALARTGARIHLWAPLPQFGIPLPAAMARNLAYGSHFPVAQPLAGHRTTFSFMAAALTRNRHRITSVIDPADLLCEGGVCRAARDGLPLYTDANHPSQSSNALFARFLAERLAALPRASGPRR